MLRRCLCFYFSDTFTQFVSACLLLANCFVKKLKVKCMYEMECVTLSVYLFVSHIVRYLQHCVSLVCTGY